MLNVFVIGRTATERSTLVKKLETLIASSSEELELIPHLTFRPTSLSELPYIGQADIVILASSIAEEELTRIKDLRSQISDTPLLVFLSSKLDKLNIIEQIARLGATDTLSEEISQKEFLRKIVLYGSVHKRKGKSGKVILVQGSKGGVGATTISVSLADASMREGKRVCLIDADFYRQCLSRFLQIKPYVNEVLANILIGRRRVDSENVEQLISPLWEEGDRGLLHVVSPPPDYDEFYTDSTHIARSFQSLLDILREQYDVVLIDCNLLRGAIRRVLFSNADVLVAVTSNDPGSLMSLVHGVTKDKQYLHREVRIFLLENRIQPSALASGVVADELSHLSSLSEYQCTIHSIEFNKVGARWPGSRESFFELTSNKDKTLIRQIALQVLGEENERRSSSMLLGSLFSRRKQNHELKNISSTDEKLQIEFKPESNEKTINDSKGSAVRFSTPIFTK